MCISIAAVMSKWKQFQSPQLAHVILYLGHTNWETGNANWHHYSAKCSPPFDLLCISVVLFSKFFFFYSIQHFFSFKSCKQRQERRVESKVWGFEALHYYQRIKHHILWSGVIFRRGGNSQVRSSRLQRMAGIKVIGIWMEAQSSQEIPNQAGNMSLNNPA